MKTRDEALRDLADLLAPVAPDEGRGGCLPREVGMSDPETIYLAPDCGEGDCGLERTWCDDDAWDDCSECGAKAVRYKSADLYEAERARAEKAEAALQLALPMMRKDDWGADYGDGTERRDALYATLAVLRRDEGDDE